MLQMRHMEQGSTGNLKINLFAKTTNIQRINLLDPLIAILLDVGKRSHEFFKTGLVASYEQRRAAYEVLRQTVLTNSKPIVKGIRVANPVRGTARNRAPRATPEIP